MRCQCQCLLQFFLTWLMTPTKVSQCKKMNGPFCLPTNCPPGGASSTSTFNTESAKVTSQSVASTSAKQLYSSVTGQNIQSQQPLKQLLQFRQSLVASVYIDQRDRDSCASSFIIFGLPSSIVHSDTYIVTYCVRMNSTSKSTSSAPSVSVRQCS